MHKKYKRVFSINNDLGYRNYTVRDLIDLKGKKKLTQIRVTTAEEAAAAEEAGIDMICTSHDAPQFGIYNSFDELKRIREAAPSCFMQSGTATNIASEYEAMKSSHRYLEIGADVIMAFDECPPYPSKFQYVKDSMKLTHRWLDRCIKKHNNSPFLYNNKQYLFPIIQGGVYNDLRKESADFVSSRFAEGYAIGGLSVGEPDEEMYKVSDLVCSILPSDKPRYLMGVGTPVNLLENISNGVDMFDCVIPTRNGRNGMLFTFEGIINIKNKKWQNDFSKIQDKHDKDSNNLYSKAYLRHLFMANEILGKQIATIHNLNFYNSLLKIARDKILIGEFASWKNKIVKKLNTRI